MSFQFSAIDDIDGLILVEGEKYGDERGWFQETYRASEYAEAGIPTTFPQDNHSRTKHEGVIRGLHYQREPRPQGKLVRCIQGSVYDVTVDLREGSPTYKHWFGMELRDDDTKQLWVPPGLAHGFCTLEPNVEFVYKVTEEWDPDLDSGFHWNDPELGIDWPVDDPIVSDKDRNAPPLAEADANFTYDEGSNS